MTEHIFSPVEPRKHKNEARHHSIAKTLCMGLFLAFISIFVGCKPKQVVIERERLVYVHSDSTRIKDSTVIIPIERYVDIVPIVDTLYLETSLAKSKSWLECNMLFGDIENKNAAEFKYIEVERVITKDSIVEKEVPVPYEVEVEKPYIPVFAWICIVWSAITLISIGYCAYKKIRGRL